MGAISSIDGLSLTSISSYYLLPWSTDITSLNERALLKLLAAEPVGPGNILTHTNSLSTFEAPPSTWNQAMDSTEYILLYTVYSAVVNLNNYIVCRAHSLTI